MNIQAATNSNIEDADDSNMESVVTETTKSTEPNSQSSSINPTIEETVPDQKMQSTPRRTTSISFGTISIREYARTIGTHVVPADGGFPLGLSSTIVTEHKNKMDENGQVISTTSSPMKESSEGSSPSPSGKHHHKHHDYHGWKIDDFESRKQVELQQRYTQLIHDQRRRNFEKQWEKKHHSQLHSKNSYNTRSKGGGRKRSGSFSGSPSKSGGGRQRSGSFSGGGGQGGKARRGSSGYCKMEMSEEEKQELEQLLANPVDLPEGVLETRPYDYKKKLPSYGNGSKGKRDDLTEEEELFHNHRGRNPLFGIIKEDERRRVLLRDDHLLKRAEDADSKTPRQSAMKMTDEDQEDISNHMDPVFTQHIQHDLESLRIERSDPCNLGCSCRKLNVFLPGESDKSHHKKKGSNRRMNERKVREELRKRGLLHKGNSDMSREKMERLLHDTVASEPCCWGMDCPCVRSGVGCQADTCSCWKEADSEPKKEGESEVEAMQRKCGNVNGMYAVDMKTIKEHRQKFVTVASTNAEM